VLFLRVFVALGLLLSACGSAGAPTSSVCSNPTVEPLDSSSGLHVLRPDEVQFDDLTPTSGPHLPVGGPLGLSTVSLPPAQQLAVLERGSVLVSVDADATDVLNAATAEFADTTVLHAVEGLPSTIVATAWQSRVSCTDLDTEYLRWFIETQTGAAAAPLDHN
jgi:hypothetical protein